MFLIKSEVCAWQIFFTTLEFTVFKNNISSVECQDSVLLVLFNFVV